tara:strand:- start:6 stop:239 length:234 start_codon:yes stop_codon:yes gene_type:complete
MRKNLNDIPKWVEENADLAKGMRVFGVDISEEMTKKELMAIVGYLSKNMLSDVDKRRKNLSLIFEGVVNFQVNEGEL